MKAFADAIGEMDLYELQDGDVEPEADDDLSDDPELQMTRDVITHATDEDGWSRHPSQRAFKAECGKTVRGDEIGFPPTCPRCLERWNERQFVEI